jgi:hypothetical protein
MVVVMAKEEPVVAMVVKEAMVATKETPVMTKSKSVSHKNMKRLAYYGACDHVTGYGSRGDG